MRKGWLVLLGMLLFVVGCSEKNKMQVTFVEQPTVIVNQLYTLEDFIESVHNGVLYLNEVSYKATRPGSYTYQIYGKDLNGRVQQFDLTIQALSSDQMPDVVEPFNLAVVEVGIEGFPINHDLLDSEEEEALKEAGAYFGELPKEQFDRFNYYQMPYFNFLFSVPVELDSHLKTYVRFIDETDTVIFGLYYLMPDVPEYLQFTCAAPVEEFVVLKHEADPNQDIEVGDFVMQLGELHVYYAQEREDLSLPKQEWEHYQAIKEGAPYITIYN